MKSSMRDNIEGKLHRIKGQVKEAIGDLMGDAPLKHEGKAENLSGKTQEKVGQVKKVLNK